MLPNLLQLLILAMSAFLALPINAASLSSLPPRDAHNINENNKLEARKSSVLLMTFYEPRCSSNGILESPLDERCEPLGPRTKGLIVERIAGGCRSEFFFFFSFFLSLSLFLSFFLSFFFL